MPLLARIALAGAGALLALLPPGLGYYGAWERCSTRPRRRRGGVVLDTTSHEVTHDVRR